MSAEYESLSAFQWLWSLLTLPIGWIWSRISTLESRLSDHKIKTAETYMTKTEIHKAIQDAVGPIRADTHEIKADVKQLLQRHSGKAG